MRVRMEAKRNQTETGTARSMQMERLNVSRGSPR